MKSDKLIDALRDKLLENEDPKFHDLAFSHPDTPKTLPKHSSDSIDELIDKFVKHILKPNALKEGIDLSKVKIGLKNTAPYSLSYLTIHYPILLDLKCKLFINLYILLLPRNTQNTQKELSLYSVYSVCSVVKSSYFYNRETKRALQKLEELGSFLSPFLGWSFDIGLVIYDE